VVEGEGAETIPAAGFAMAATDGAVAAELVTVAGAGAGGFPTPTAADAGGAGLTAGVAAAAGVLVGRGVVIDAGGGLTPVLGTGAETGSRPGAGEGVGLVCAGRGGTAVGVMRGAPLAPALPVADAGG
jgi:hypothetical protein